MTAYSERERAARPDGQCVYEAWLRASGVPFHDMWARINNSDRQRWISYAATLPAEKVAADRAYPAAAPVFKPLSHEDSDELNSALHCAYANGMLEGDLGHLVEALADATTSEPIPASVEFEGVHPVEVEAILRARAAADPPAPFKRAEPYRAQSSAATDIVRQSQIRTTNEGGADVDA